MQQDLITTTATGLVVLILIFLLCREILTWYWKINQGIRLQKETNELLQSMRDELRNMAAANLHRPGEGKAQTEQSS